MTCMTTFKSNGGVDIILIALIMVAGIFAPQAIFQDIEAWNHDDIPGQTVVLTYEGTNTTTFLVDPHFAFDHTDDPYFDSIVFTILAGPLVFIIVMMTMYILSFEKLSRELPNSKMTNKFELRWFIPELLTFGYSYAYSMSMCCWMTYILKWLVSWPRPDCIGRCNINYENVNDVYCDVGANDNTYLEAWKSFPSLQASIIFCAMSVLVFFLWGKITLKRPLYFELCNAEWYYDPLIDLIVATPFILATWVSATRVIDHLSFPTDVLGGAFLGFVCARIGFQTQYKLNSPFSYRSLTFPSIRHLICENEFLRLIIYPKVNKYQGYEESANKSKSESINVPDVATKTKDAVELATTT